MTNLVKNDKFLQSSSAPYDVYDSEANWRNIAATNGAAPDWWFYLGGPDYPNYPNLDPTGFADAGAQWVMDSFDNDPTISRSVMIDLSDSRARSSGGVTQVVPILQTSLKPFKFSCAVKSLGTDGDTKVIFDVIGFDTHGSGSTLTYLPGDNAWTKKTKIASFTFPLKYAFFHLSVQECTKGQVWFALPWLEEIDVQTTPEKPGNLTMNYNFFHTSDDTDTIGWDVVNCTRTEDATPDGVIGLVMTAGGSLAQAAILVPSDFARRIVQMSCKSATSTTIRITAVAKGRYRNEINRTVTEQVVGTSWANLSASVLCSESVEMIDILIEHVSGDAVEFGSVTLTTDTGFSQKIDFSKSTYLQNQQTTDLQNLPRCFDTFATDLPSPISLDKVDVTLADGDIGRRLFLTNGRIGAINIHEYISDLAMFKFQPLNQVNTSNVYSLTPWSDPHDVYVNGEPIPKKLGIVHVTNPDLNVSTTGGNLPDGTTRYYLVTAYKIVNGVKMETGQSNEVRAITPTATPTPLNTNQVPLEITPVKYADGYRVYVTSQIETDQTKISKRRKDAGYNQPIWGTNSLLFDVSAQQLRDAGYILWDTNQPLNAGSPPVPIYDPGLSPNNAVLWTPDPTNSQVTVAPDFVGTGTMTASVPVPANTGFAAVKYLPHSGEYYIATADGIFQPDTYFKHNLYVVKSISNVVSLDYYGDELWYTLSDGTAANLSGSLTKGVSHTYNTPIVGSKILRDGRLVLLLQNGLLVVDGVQNMSLPVGTYVGLSGFYDELMTFDTVAKDFVVFDLSATITQRFHYDRFSSVDAFDLSGTYLSVFINQVGIISSFLMAENYYGVLDETARYGKIQYLPVPRPTVADEAPKPVYPEICPNGNLMLGGVTMDSDKLPKPVGFTLIGIDGASVKTPVVTAAWDVGPDANSRSIKFSFAKGSWGSINREKMPVVGGQTYRFSAVVKGTYAGGGNMGVQFINDTRSISEVFTSFTNTPNWTTIEAIVTAPMDATHVELRILNYGTDSQASDYYVSYFSFQEYNPPVKPVDWNYLFNGDFSMYPQGGSIPTGWSMGGGGASEMVPSIVSPTMQADGMGLAIQVPLYNSTVDNWHALESQTFNIGPKENTELDFWMNYPGPSSFELWISIVLYDANGNQFDSVATYPTVNPGQNFYRFKIPETPAGTDHGYLRLNFQNTPVATTFTFEDIKLLPSFDTNMLENADFSAGLSGWSAWLDGTTYSRVGDSVRTVNGVTETVPHCGILELPLNDTNDYNHFKQFIHLDPTETRAIEMKATLRAELYSGGPGFAEFNCEFETTANPVTYPWIDSFGFNTQVPADGEWHTNTYVWTPTQPVDLVWVHVMAHEGARGIIYVKEVSFRYIDPAPVLDSIALTVPDRIPVYNPLGVDRSTQEIITAAVQYQGANVAARGLPIQYSVSPSTVTVDALQTGNDGVSKATLTIPYMLGSITVTASYGGYTTTKLIAVTPIGDRLAEVDHFRSSFVKPAGPVSKLYVEMETEKTLKPIVLVPDRPGVWEVFTPTEFNADQMADYQMHYSSESDLSPTVNANITTKKYPQSFYPEYFDYLGAYPYEDAHIMIAQYRKEWNCLESTGISDPFGSGRSYYSWNDRECTEWFVNRFIRISKERGYYDGVYLDDFWGEGYDLIQDFNYGAAPSDVLNFKSIKDRIDAQYNSLMWMQKKLHMEGKLLVCNYGVGKDYDFTQDPPQFITYEAQMLHQPFDGLLREVWLYGDTEKPWDITNPSFDLTFVHKEIHFLHHMNSLGKHVVCLARRALMDFDSRTFSFAAYLLGKGDRSYFMWSHWGTPWTDGYYGYGWHSAVLPETQIYTGLPLEDYQLNNGLFSRRFENVVALLNMNDLTQLYTLPAGNWYGLRDGPYSGTISLARRHALVLMKQKP